ncbi:MAG TPA: hypothetical protein VGN32_13330 [Ktedonobacterales bacterium]|nr:hypothetical protein [Ktedonobacterales bacterium]
MDIRLNIRLNARRDVATGEVPIPPTAPTPRAQAGVARATAPAVRDLLEGLEPEQLSAVKHAARVGRRALGPGSLLLFWALRVYVVVMLLLVAHQIWIVLHP